MPTLTFEEVKQNGWLVLEAITGSKAYGLDTATSDTDIRGVFVLPKHLYYSLDSVEQVANETNDIVYYELKRFVELLSRNNPNIMELLALPEKCILYKDDIISALQPELFLSKLCEKTFANYAYTQIKKAFGLEKKIVNPMDEPRKSVLDFCFVYMGKQTLPLAVFLSEKNYLPEHIGLAAIAHLKDCYNLYYSTRLPYAGIVKKETSNDVTVSSVPKEETPVAMLYFNKDGYSVYCKKYKEYQDWVAKRNDARYNNTMAHGKKYDSKNMMHVFRLLLMAKEIATEGKINVWRNDREFLLSIKAGQYEYDELVEKAEVLKDELPSLYAASLLPEAPDLEQVNALLVRMRERYYK